MRSNGLQAPRYVPIAELDPQVADLMLELLRRAGVAAYAEPCDPTRGPSLEVSAPATPLERLYVDEHARPRAQELVQGYLGAAGGSDEPSGAGRDDAGAAARLPDNATTVDEQAWAGIVAAYHATPSDRVPSWPAIEDLGDDAEGGSARSGRDGGGSARDGHDGRASPEVGGRGGPGTGSGSAEDDHFVPPPPPPLPVLDSVTKIAWLAMVGGPASLLLFVILGWYLPDWILVLCTAAFAGGFLTLVLRMQGRSPEDPEDPDQGAVV